MLSKRLIEAKGHELTRLVTKNLPTVNHAICKSFSTRTQVKSEQIVRSGIAKQVQLSYLQRFVLSGQSRLQNFTWRMSQKDEKPDDESKVPPGFEKLLKKTRKIVKGDKEGEKSAEKGEKKQEEAASPKTEQEDLDDGEPHDAEFKKKGDEEPKKRSTFADRGNRYKDELSNMFMKPNNGGPKWEAYLLFAVAMGWLSYRGLILEKPAEEISYQEFINNLLTKNQVEVITLSENVDGSSSFKYRATIQTIEGKKHYMVMPQVENFLYKLDLAQREMGKDVNNFVPVKYGPSLEGQTDTVNTAFAFMFFGTLLYMMFRSSHGRPTKGVKGKVDKGSSGPFGGGGLNDMMGMNKANAQVFGVDKKMRTRFKHVAGLQNAKTEVTEFVDFLKSPEKYKKLGAKVPRGALLTGPPGTGKTLLAKAVAGEAGVPFLSISGSDFVQMYVGVGAGRVRDLFKQAKSMSPSIIFIDEIDAVAKKRDQKFGGNDERDNTLNQLLVEMDGFTTDESVIILAATNLADQLDPAIKRPGRFDRQIEINLPSIDERREIYNVHLRKIKVDKERTRDEYATRLSALTPGFSGADIANVCNEGAIIAARDDEKSVTMKKFEQATERVIGGIEKKIVMSPAERRTVAYHEAGHAVAGWFFEHSNPLLKITIIPRAKGSLGFAQYLPEELNLYTREQLIDMVCVALGGRIAEEIFFNKVTTGASDDIKKVTQIVQSLISVYGMSDKIGLVSFAADSQYGTKAYSDETTHEIDVETKRIVDECYARTKQMLEDKRELIEGLAEKLLEKESINLPQIIKVLGERPFPMKENLVEYLREIESRNLQEEERAAKEAEEREATPAAADSQEPDAAEPSQESTEESTESKPAEDDDSKKEK